ncbi:MAG: hotdog fold domain-containing protein [Limnochordia bacterium]|jgi:3-aminobutyryl-CoA ammonia-lyase|nr:hotdog fold domain-containing protein [Limnochordia bacterium]MDI9464108.1 hotdog fold domain-containing protein [Bacillota bacterium]HOB40910.1 hotdog fold domain-containing protein [Limnochordia bacterium]HOK31400.1 hotdog fold domain-containing protein [Limnochordia bacterium]HOM00176.1 hotdog fold domain-containing protein [Limnochordia bacterium]
MLESVLRVRVSAAQAHYGGGLVDGAFVLQLFGDAATELLIRHDGDEGLFLTYSEVMFRAPVYAGDFLEVRARLTEVGNTSRKMEFQAVKQITRPQESGLAPSAMDVLEEPILVAEAKGVCVVPKERQRRG